LAVELVYTWIAAWSCKKKRITFRFWCLWNWY